jgi:hypothetical protein
MSCPKKTKSYIEHDSTVKLDYIELGYNEQILKPNWSFKYIINPAITNLGYNKQKCPDPSCSL